MELMSFDFNIGDVVYLSTDPDQHPRIVTAITIRGSHITYELSFSSSETTWHMPIEISATKNSLISF